MNKREKEILNILLESQGESSLKKVARGCGVTERSIRYSLESLNEKLRDEGIPEVVLGGMGSVTIGDRDEFLRRYREEPSREVVLLLGLIFQPVIKLTHISRALDVSSSTLKRELKEIEKNILTEGLKTGFIPGRGIALEGDELSIRKLGVNYISRNMRGSILRRKTFVEEMRQYAGEKEENVLRDFLKKTEERIGGRISDEAFEMILAYLMISVSRIRAGRGLSRVKNARFLSETNEYLGIKDEAADLAKALEIEISEDEMLQLTDYIAGAHGYGFEFSYYDNWVENSINIKKIIEITGERMGVNLRRSDELFEGLLNHIKPALYRIKNGIRLNNSISCEVKREYPEILKAAGAALGEVYRDRGIEFSEDETAFISLHFKTALNRIRRDEDRRVRAIFVCSYGIGSSRLLAGLLTDHLMIDVLGITPYYQLEDELERHGEIDMIISTLDIPEIRGVEVVRVEAIPTEDDIEGLLKRGVKKRSKRISLTEILEIVEKYGRIDDRERLIGELVEAGDGIIYNDRRGREPGLKGCLPLDRIVVEGGGYPWEDAVAISCVPLIRDGLVTYDYARGIVDAVEEYGSYMVVSDTLAIPHYRDEGREVGTGMALTVYREPVVFPDGRKASVFLTFSSRDNKEHLQALTEFINIFEEGGTAERIRKARSREEILRLLALDA